MLNVPITEERPWVVFAACRDADSDIFFIDPGGDPGPAQAICASCPVRVECLEYAMDARLTSGIWGGLTPKQRRRELRRQRRRTA